MKSQHIIKLILVLIVIVINGCAIQPEPIKVAESDIKLFGKLKTWEIEKISERVYAYRYTFYRNFFLIGDEGVIVTDPLTVDAASILNKNGIIVLHRHKNETDHLPPNFQIIEQKVYGISKIIFLTYLN